MISIKYDIKEPCLTKVEKIAIVTNETLLLFVFKMLLPKVKIKCIKHTRKPV